ncbi:MAG: T9SS type A sorting domain-containing protein, partial [Ignavibacteria bacterium]|nr:T9SS type A sorting domain-containing protein [Ignavibacteria bacterium]
TVISYSLHERTNVIIRIYDISGKEIRYIFQGLRDAGEHRVEFNASGLASGVYFYRIEAGDFTETRKMVLLR